MKKFAFFGIAALIVMFAAFAIVSCDMGASNEQNQSFVPVESTVFINVNGSTRLPDGRTARALTGPASEGGTTFYEATFKDSSNNYIRTTWDWSTDGAIQLLPDNYDVVVLAGRGTDRTLLAMGYISEVHNNTNTSPTYADRNATVVILPDTWGLTITLYPLLTNVGGSVRHSGSPLAAQPWNKAISTFKITDGDFLGTGDPDDYILDNVAVDFYGNKVPVFHIETGTASDPTATATWEFLVGGGLPWSTDPTPAGNKIADYDDVIFVHNLNGKVKQAGFSDKGSPETPSLLERAKYAGPDGALPSAASQTPITGGIFDLEFQVKADEHGLTQIAIEVPVFAMHPTLGNPQTWWIRGGLNSSLNDVGANPTTGLSSPAIQGGGIVIGFGNLASIPDIGLYPGGPPATGTTTITDAVISIATAPANFVPSGSALITSTSTQYTTSIQWEETSTPGVPFTGSFGGTTGYTAVITITPASGYTYAGLATTFFSITHDSGSASPTVSFNNSTGVITVVY